MKFDLLSRTDRTTTLKQIRAKASAGPLMSISAWKPTRVRNPDTGAYSDDFHLNVFVPPIARSIDLVIEIPRWKGEPTASLTVPLPAMKSDTAAASIVGEDLQVHDLRWESRGQNISFELRTRPGLLALGRWDGLLCFDERGQQLMVTPVGHTEDERGGVLEVEVLVARDSKSMTLEVYSTEQLEGGSARFEFKGLPAPVDLDASE